VSQASKVKTKNPADMPISLAARATGFGGSSSNQPASVLIDVAFINP